MDKREREGSNNSSVSGVGGADGSVNDPDDANLEESGSVVEFSENSEGGEEEDESGDQGNVCVAFFVVHTNTFQEKLRRKSSDEPENKNV